MFARAILFSMYFGGKQCPDILKSLHIYLHKLTLGIVRECHIIRRFVTIRRPENVEKE